MASNPSWPSLELHPVKADFPALTIGTRTLSGASSARLYVCGITPYDSTHLGHAATYLTFDLANRYLQLSGRAVSFVENITDIDDPLLERAQRDGVSWESLARSQIDLFTSDMTQLHVCAPNHFVPVTQVIPLIADCISALIAKGATYTLDGDIYFNISPYLKDLPLPEKEALAIFAERGGDPTREGKQNPLDPLLWMQARSGEPHWQTSIGNGRPGWHIECSAISLRYLLGEDFLTSATKDFLIDIQGGGTDLIFPHHFMSAALAHAMTGVDFAQSYLHVGMIGLDGEKMSKSKGNLVFVSQLISDGTHPASIRLALMNHHYSEDFMWDSKHLESSNNLLSRLQSVLGSGFSIEATSYIQSMVEALASNLDTKRVLQILEDWIEGSEKAPESLSIDDTGLMARTLDSLLGLSL
jgi:L-cysteine:1D-myo-inositol 2-amino-2-deoxy-alpha-D-glucopyranoside ligase